MVKKTREETLEENKANIEVCARGFGLPLLYLLTRFFSLSDAKRIVA